jgi:hypothetical protein
MTAALARLEICISIASGKPPTYKNLPKTELYHPPQVATQINSHNLFYVSYPNYANAGSKNKRSEWKLKIGLLVSRGSLISSSPPSKLMRMGLVIFWVGGIVNWWDWMDLKRKRDYQAERNTKNEELGGKGKGIAGKRWEEGVLILMRGESSRGTDVVDLRWRRGIWDDPNLLGGEDDCRDEFVGLGLVVVVVEGWERGHRGDSG